MIFNTWTFAVFALVVVCAYWAAPSRAKPYLLVVAGTVFYAWAVPEYAALVAALGAVTFACGRAMLATSSARARDRLLWAGAALIVGVLVFYKYSNFLASTVDRVAARAVLPVPHVLVPLAISFFTFEFVHVLVDVRLGKILRLDPLEFTTFTLFFPTLVAGPIKRYQSFAPQVRHIVPPDQSEFALHFYRIAIGLFKKLVPADSLTVLTQPLLAPGAPYDRVDYAVAVAAYTFKIYFDFSGYSDIAIGTAGLLGIAIPENFERPYWSANISEFWARWHISLSTWIRDYVFIPLGGSRRPPAIVLVNLVLAMALSGLWHGAAFTFVVWGLWHGFGLAVHRLWSQWVAARVPFLTRPSGVTKAVSVGATFSFVMLGWVLFAASSLDSARRVYAILVFGAN